MVKGGFFKNMSSDARKLAEYGFESADGRLAYAEKIADGQFVMTVEVDGSGEVFASVKDGATGDPYTLHLVESAGGEFVGMVRAEYARVLGDIADKCFLREVFKSPQTKAVLGCAREKFGCEPEFLWEKLPTAAVLRRGDTGKWYAVLMKIDGARFGREGEVEIADFRADPADVEELVDGKSVFSGYHMNKKHWITVVLDGSASQGRAEELLGASYLLAK